MQHVSAQLWRANFKSGVTDPARQMLRCAWLIFLGLLFAPPTAFGADAVDHVAQVPSNGQEIRVLFIGNSLTYYNNLAGLVSSIAMAQGGRGVAPGLALRGATDLRWHLENGSARTLLQSGRWDYVVLQDRGLLGGAINGEPVIGDISAFHASVREWVVRIRAVGAKPVLFMTWAARLETPIVWRQQEQLAAAYFAIGKELGVAVAPVGLAWAEARRRFISLDLHTWDGYHPSPAGSYLAACVIYSVLAQKSPIGAPSALVGHPIYESGPDGNDAVVDDRHQITLVDLPSSLARELQRVAWDIVSAAGRFRGS